MAHRPHSAPAAREVTINRGLSIFLSLYAIACSNPSAPIVRTATLDTGNASTLDTALQWEGDIAIYDGCTDADPEAVVLYQRAPQGPAMAGGMVAGEVVFANCSDTVWVAAETDDATSGVKLGAVSETVMETWSRPRVALPVDVAPGEAVRIVHDGIAPMTNGHHRWQWQLVDEWVRWIDAPTQEASVEVSGGYGPFDVHTRDEWEQSSYPMDGPDMDLLGLEYITIHYNGSTKDLDGDDDIYTDEDTISSIRSGQISYVTQRGYSYGYNSLIAPDGDEWEIRGYEFRSAANGCTDVNVAGYAIQIPTTSPDADPTAAQIEGARAAILRIRRAAAAAGNTNVLTINGHRDVRPLCSDGAGTACPGEPIYDFVTSGALEP